MKKRTKKKLISLLVLIIISIIVYFFGDKLGIVFEENTPKTVVTVDKVENIPEYSGSPYVIINDNKPNFTEEDMEKGNFEIYSDLDELYRCGTAFANVCKATMPKDGEARGDISSVKPTGWVQASYDGEYLYNRCHLIGHQLAAENANERNLITGTRYFNVKGMLPFENEVDDYIEANEKNHVLYRVTPYFEGENLLANGVQMEAYSIEDKGQGVCFNVYVYNVKPGIVIDYATGESKLEQ